MNDKDILRFISDELTSSEQDIDFETPLNYYLGTPRGDEVDGRSTVISTDVADAIEWIMPQIMRSFTQNNEILIFDPINPNDEFQAELESQYVYEVLMKDNNGFIILHQLVKDALMQQNGFIKVWYSKETIQKTVKYSGLTPEQFQMVLSANNAEIINKEQIITQSPIPGGQPVISFDASIAITREVSKINIESVSPDDIRINKDHNSINMDDAKFAAHLMTKTVSDLRTEGVDEDIIQELIHSATGGENHNSYRFTAQDESVDPDTDDSIDESLITIYLAECYTFADIDDSGIAKRVKITVGGQYSPTVIVDKEEIDSSPWISATAILMSHKLYGLSIYDRLKQIQDIKTSLLRNTLDNVYLQNNQRHLVLEKQVTMEDLMTSRPGGIVRTKSLDAVKPLVTPSFIGDAFQMLGYLDQTRAGRSGVSPEDSFKDYKIGERVGSEGVERLMSAKEELVGLIVRIIAETGVKPLCYKIRNLCTIHIDSIVDFQFRGQWVKVNPAAWPDRVRTTVRVGTGSGQHDRQVAALTQVLGKQAEIAVQPGQVLVLPKNQFKALDDLCKFTGLNSAVGYFVDPDSQEGKQLAQQIQQQQQQQQQQAMELQKQQLAFQQQLAQAETEKANTARMNTELKAQAEKAKYSLLIQKQQSDQIIASLQQQIDQLKEIQKGEHEGERIDLEREKALIDAGIRITEIEMKDKQASADRMVKHNAETASTIQSSE